MNNSFFFKFHFKKKIIRILQISLLVNMFGNYSKSIDKYHSYVDDLIYIKKSIILET